MLDIRTFRSGRNGVRVDVFRKYKHTDEKTGRPATHYKQLGSFLLADGHSPTLITLLQPDEVIQLQNWLAEMRFAAQFDVEVEDLLKCTLRVPRPFQAALARLYSEAKRVSIDFVPHEVMLDALLHKAKLVQQKVDKINGFKSGVLESSGIQCDVASTKETQEHLYDNEGQQLFKALLKLDQPVGKICTALEDAAKAYGKHKKIPPPQLRTWAGEMPSRNPDPRIKKWAYAIAIDVLHQYGIDPLTLVKPETVAVYWAIQRQEKYTLKEAIAQFIKMFAVSDEKKPAVIASITQVYKKLTSL